MSKSPEERIQKLEAQKTACLKKTEIAAHEDDDQYSYVDILEGSYLEMKRSNDHTFLLRCNVCGFSIRHLNWLSSLRTASKEERYR